MNSTLNYDTIVKAIDNGLWETDPILIPALADVLEEQGDEEEAQAVREIIKLGVLPQGVPRSAAWWSYKCSELFINDNNGVKEARVPENIFKCLDGQSHGSTLGSVYMAYSSYSDAYFALARAIIASKKDEYKIYRLQWNGCIGSWPDRIYEETVRARDKNEALTVFFRKYPSKKTGPDGWEVEQVIPSV